MKFNHNIFELAAERQSLYTGNYLDEISSFSCDNIAHTISCVFSNQILNNRLKLTQEYQDLYAEYFEPEIPWDEFGWWEDDENEPRVFALLLMAEIVKDLNKAKKARKKRK